ncbi:protein FAM210A isoform X2 [Uranotaenia lowii]|uniref:protein FAM210A isoform X2 n=1 Tax=Uranotaenia lowii TaxID=190385 RepID=UPI0024799229|nr:protein FAM210A isoform X2 [Uranotaenia lowii]
MSLLLNLPRLGASAKRGLLKWPLGNRFSTQLINVNSFAGLASVEQSYSCYKWNEQSGNGRVLKRFPALQQYQLRNIVRQSILQQQVQKQPSEQQQTGNDSGSAYPPPVCEPENLGLFARFKKMAKEYWYVLIPVHCLTSVFWFGGFYYASKSGVDVIAVLESMGVSPKLIDPVRDSSLGHIAVAYLLYKIATPARYTITLGEAEICSGLHKTDAFKGSAGADVQG